MSISSTIKSIQDIMRKDVGVDGDAQRLSQLVWMLFLKIFDDRESEWELLQDKYRSPLPEKYRWRNWAANAEGMTGDELKQFLDNDLFPALQNLEAKGGDQRAYVIRSVFEDAYNYMKSGQLIRQVINKIQEGVDFNKAQERHLFGDMYEQLLRDLQAAGNAGEFYTPRAVTEFMVQMVNPRLGEKVMDPACGTGGFLSCSIEHIRKQDVKTLEDEAQLQGSIYGIEKKPMPHLLCTTNMILHGIDVPSNIRHDNTLARPLISWGPSERVDVIVTNPPFGGMEEDGIETNFPATFRTRETADLFLVLIMQMLKPGGRAAVVLPDGFLFGEGIKTRIKEKLLEECNLHTIVRLPKGVFAPYTSINTNLIFFTKGAPTKNVWFYEHPYPEGVKSYNKTKPMRIQEFEVEKSWWGSEGDSFKDRKENECAWKVTIEDIKARNYSLDIKNPQTLQGRLQDPEDLLAKYQRLREEISIKRKELGAVLENCFLGNLELSLVQRILIERFDICTAPDLEKKLGRGRSSSNAGGVYGIHRLRELILNLGIRGFLVPQLEIEGYASELLEAIELRNTNLSKNSVSKRKKSQAIPVGDIKNYSIPSQWAVGRLGDIATLITKGTTPTSLGHSYQKSGVNFIKVENVSDGIINIDSIDQYISHEVDRILSRSSLEVDDILFSIAGTIGRTCIVRDCDIPANTNQAFAIIRGTRDVFYPTFLLKQLDSFVADQIKEKARGGAMNNVSLLDLSQVILFIPPIEEQKRISLKIDEIMALCDELEASIIQFINLQRDITDVVIGGVIS